MTLATLNLTLNNSHDAKNKKLSVCWWDLNLGVESGELC